MPRLVVVKLQTACLVLQSLKGEYLLFVNFNIRHVQRGPSSVAFSLIDQLFGNFKLLEEGRKLRAILWRFLVQILSILPQFLEIVRWFLKIRLFFVLQNSVIIALNFLFGGIQRLLAHLTFLKIVVKAFDSGPYFGMDRPYLFRIFLYVPLKGLVPIIFDSHSSNHFLQILKAIFQINSLTFFVHWNGLFNFSDHIFFAFGRKWNPSLVENLGLLSFARLKLIWHLLAMSGFENLRLRLDIRMQQRTCILVNSCILLAFMLQFLFLRIQTILSRLRCVNSLIRIHLLQQRQLQFDFLFHLTFFLDRLFRRLLDWMSVYSIDNLSFAT